MINSTHSDENQDIENLYSASRTDGSPAELDDLIRTTASKKAKPSAGHKKSFSVFDPPIAIAATLVLTIGLVTLLRNQPEQTTLPPEVMTESPERLVARHIEDAPSLEAAPELADETTREMSNESGQVAVTDTLDEDESHIAIEETPAIASVNVNQQPAATQPDTKNEAGKAITPQPIAAGKLSLATAPEPEIKQEMRASRMPAALSAPIESSMFTDEPPNHPIESEIAPSKTETPQAFAATESSSSAALARVKRISPNQGDIRTVTGKMEVWYNENHRWVSPERFFELELKRLNGPSYGKTNTYPDYDTTKEWETLIEILPDGRECPMVFFHERWRRLADVLALDERLRNYGGCADVFDQQ